MTFNSDRSKQVHEAILSRKLKKVTHPPLLFSNNNVSQVSSQKHIGVILDIKLVFEEYLKNLFNKTPFNFVVSTENIFSFIKTNIQNTFLISFPWEHIPQEQ